MAAIEVSFISGDELHRVEVGLRRNATKAKREEATRILGLRGFLPMVTEAGLNAEEWIALRDGLAPTATALDFSEARKVLEKHGFRHERDIAREFRGRAKKPGPKKKGAINPTEEDLRRLVESARKALGLESKTTRLEILYILHEVISEADDFLGGQFLVSASDIHALQAFVDRGRRDKCQEYSEIQDLVTELEKVFNGLEGCGRRHGLSLEALAYSGLDELPSAADMPTEEKIFLRLAVDLGFDLPAQLGRIGIGRDVVQTGATTVTPSDPSAGRAEAPLVLAEVRFSRVEILRTALAKLRHLNVLFKDCSRSIRYDELRLVETCVRSTFPWHLAEPILGRYMGDLQDLFLRIRHRQGVCPVGRMRLEDLNFEPKAAGEADSFTGGYRDGARQRGVDGLLARLSKRRCETALPVQAKTKPTGLRQRSKKAKRPTSGSACRSRRRKQQ